MPIRLSLPLLLLLATAGTCSQQGSQGYGQVGYHYIGCYKDARDRDLPKLAAQKSMTVEKCFEECSKRGYEYFGLQYSYQCFCGHSFGRYGLRDDAECKASCDGDNFEFCGGSWRNSVYATNVRVARHDYIGCFKDTASRDLPKLAIERRATIQSCHRRCSELKYRYFGLQYYGQCWCGNYVGKHGSVSNSECSARCHANKQQRCGNAWRNSVYSTGMDVFRRNYVGCFKDAASRDLPKLAMAKAATVEQCLRRCAELGYAFAGLQYSRQCFCGNSAGRHGHVSDAECSMRCDADKREICGNNWRNSVYFTGVKVALNPYLGCYKDARNRDLPKSAGDKSMTREKCAKNCGEKGYKYFGLQYSTQCFCGNSFGKHGAASDRDCSSPCTGNRRQICGNSWRNSVYATAVTASWQNYIGCFKDSSARDLPKLASTKSMSVEKCKRLCSSQRYTYFGLQYSGQCFCGNSFGKYGGVSDRECSMKCSGNQRQVCGGNWRNSVYATGVEAVQRNYIGCFKDTAKRDLPTLVATGDMSVQRCFKLCAKKNFLYYGLQYSTQCFCGNSFGKYGGASDAECLMRCKGNSNDVCGGTWRNSVYSTGIKVVKHHYVGCFKDTRTRDLPKLIATKKMTTRRCFQLCSEEKFAFFGLQYSTQCFCGDFVGKYGRVNDSECKMKCSGNSNENCGGVWRNSVYATGVDVL